MDLESVKRQSRQWTEKSNDSLTHEELTQLRKAEEDLQRAQAAYDELEPLRQKRAFLFHVEERAIAQYRLPKNWKRKNG